MATNEERLASLETSATVFKWLLVGLLSITLGLYGITSYVHIPDAVESTSIKRVEEDAIKAKESAESSATTAATYADGCRVAATQCEEFIQALRGERIIRGFVSPDGSAIGDGFVASKSKEGAYRMQFSTSFKAKPIVLVTVFSKDQYKPGGKEHPADTTISASSSPDEALVWTYNMDKDGRSVPKSEGFFFVAFAP